MPHHAALHPARYVAGLAHRFLDLGGQIAQDTLLTGYERRGSGFWLRTTRGTVQSRDLVVATNGYTRPATPYLRHRIIPVTSYMITTEELPKGILTSLFPTGRMVTDTNQLLCYYRLSPDRRRILFGGRPAYTEIGPQRAAKRLGNYLRTLFPALADARISHSWFGYIGYAFDHLPHLGSFDGIHYTGGYCGSGVVMATWLGRKLAARVTGAGEGRSAFAKIPHLGHPLYRGRPWFLPVVHAWYQLGDLWDRGR